jgi:hypothetical protein
METDVASRRVFYRKARKTFPEHFSKKRKLIFYLATSKCLPDSLSLLDFAKQQEKDEFSNKVCL